MKGKLIFIFLLLVKCLWAQDNSTWRHVGPFSNTNSSNSFTTGRVLCVAADTRSGFQYSYYAGSPGGLWASYNGGANWGLMDPVNRMHYSGANAIAVGPTTGNVYIASTDIDGLRQSWDSIYVCNSTTLNWSALNPFTTAKCLVDNIRFFPGNENIIYVCTNIGLFRSINGGTSWTQVDNTTEIYDIVFVQNGASTYYYTTGNHVFKESTNGTTFTDVSSVESLFNVSTWKNMLGDICLGDQSTNNRDMYILAAVNNGSSTDATAEYQVYKVTKNVSSGSISSSLYYSFHEYDNAQYRLALTYANIDATDKLLFFGGVYMYYINTVNPPPAFNQANGTSIIHTDQHYLVALPGTQMVLSACDGGFSAFNYSGYISGDTPGFSAENVGLDISQVVGFSGDNADSTFIDGEQDTYGFMLNTPSTNSTVWSPYESDGGMIDKFNNNLIIGLPDEYQNSIWYSTDHGASFYQGNYPKVQCGGGNDIDTNYYLSFIPDYIPTPGASSFSAYVTPYATSEECEAGVWGMNTLYQDPSRPNIMYHGNGTLNQWDSVQKVFAGKFSPFAIFGGLDSLHSIDWYGAVISMGMSPVYKNALYLTTACRSHIIDPAISPPNEHASQIIKFIGPNIDDVWSGHNEDASHWQEITPNINSIYGLSLNNEQLRGFNYASVVVSTWNPNKVWACTIGVQGAPQVKVLQYDNGTWTDYSAGIPSGEYALCMVSEIGSNDGLYLATNRGVYYRNATSLWQPYMNNIPHVLARQMEINYAQNTIRAGTYGRGIWLSGLNCPGNSSLTRSNSTNSEFDEVTQTISSTATITAAATQPDGWPTMVNYRAGQSVTLTPGFSAVPGSDFIAYIHPCGSPGNSLIRKPQRNVTSTETNVVSTIEHKEYNIKVYPNPNSGMFSLKLPEDELSNITVYNLLGEVVYSKEQVEELIQIDLSNQPKGVYFVKAINSKDGSTDVKRVLVQ